MNDATRVRRAMILCVSFTRNLAYFRAGKKSNSKKFTQEFWRTINNNFVDICILEWCKLFGNRNDEHHWQKISEDSEQFRNNMFSALDITQDVLDEYWIKVKEYRDEFVAHLLTKDEMNIPDLNLAWKTIEFYYKFLFQKCHEIGGDLSGFGPNLALEYEGWLNEAIDEYSK